VHTVLKLILCSLGFHFRQSLFRANYIFIRSCYSIYKHQGFSGLVLNLKMCHMLLIHSVAGYTPKVKGVPRVALSGANLPKVIPLPHRIRIRNNDKNIIRL
jgi:hypothetical protein